MRAQSKALLKIVEHQQYSNITEHGGEEVCHKVEKEGK